MSRQSCRSHCRLTPSSWSMSRQSCHSSCRFTPSSALSSGSALPSKKKNGTSGMSEVPNSLRTDGIDVQPRNSTLSVAGAGEGRIVEGRRVLLQRRVTQSAGFRSLLADLVRATKPDSSVPHRKVVSPHWFPLAMAGRGWPNQGKGERDGRVNGESHLGPTPLHSVPGDRKEDSDGDSHEGN